MGAGRVGRARPRSRDLGLSPPEFAQAEALRDARARLHALGGPGSGPEADSAVSEVRRIETALAGRSRRPRDVDPDSLGLQPGESAFLLARAGPRTLVDLLLRADADPVVKVLPIAADDLVGIASAWTARVSGVTPLPTPGDPSDLLAGGPGAGPPPRLPPEAHPGLGPGRIGAG